MNSFMDAVMHSVSGSRLVLFFRMTAWGQARPKALMSFRSTNIGIEGES